MRIRKRLQLYFGLCKWYGQRKEDKIVAKYFGSFRGTLLSIGENDGMIYSNVLYFIKRGWKADLVEPSPEAFRRLGKRHLYNSRVECTRVAIGEKSGRVPFWESDSLVNLGDTGLVSTLKPIIRDQWTGTKFKQTSVEVVTFAHYIEHVARFQRYDLISLDAEGSDMEILQQMDLQKLGCRCLIVEHAGNPQPVINLVQPQGYYRLAATEENIIFVSDWLY